MFQYKSHENESSLVRLIKEALTTNKCRRPETDATIILIFTYFSQLINTLYALAQFLRVLRKNLTLLNGLSHNKQTNLLTY